MDYVEKANDTYRLSGTRVSLESVVYAFLNGQTPESIAQSFPTLSLEQVYGTVTYYLAHRAEVDAYLESCRADSDAQRKAAQEKDPLFHQKLADARHRSKVKQP